MPGEDVQELSKLLPPTFNRFKDNNIAQVITGCAIVTHPTTFVPGKSPQRLLAAAGKSDDQFTGHVVDAGIQSMKR